MSKSLFLFLIIIFSYQTYAQNIKAFLNKGKEALKQNKFDSGQIYFENALILFDETMKADDYYTCYENLLLCFYYKKNYDKIISLTQDALDQNKFNLSNNNKWKAMLYAYLALGYGEKHDFYNSYRINRKALKLKKSIDDDYLGILNNLGVVSVKRGDFSSAIDYHKEAINASHKLKKKL